MTKRESETERGRVEVREGRDRERENTRRGRERGREKERGMAPVHLMLGSSSGLVRSGPEW